MIMNRIKKYQAALEPAAATEEPVLCVVDFASIPPGMGGSTLKALYWAQMQEFSIKELSQHLGVTAAAMTGTLDTMETHHWATRQPHRKDRRKVMVRLTENGRDLARRIFPLTPALVRDALTQTDRPGR